MNPSWEAAALSGDLHGKTVLDLVRDKGNPQLVELLDMTPGEGHG